MGLQEEKETVVENSNWNKESSQPTWENKKNVEDSKWKADTQGANWNNKEEQKKQGIVDEDGNIISVIPVEQEDEENPYDVKSVYNIDFEDDNEEARKEAEEEAARKEAEEEAARKAAEEEAARKAAKEEAARKAAEEEAARKAAEEEAARKASEEAVARKAAEEEAARKAAEEEAARKAAAEEAARIAAEEEARVQAEAKIEKSVKNNNANPYQLPNGASEFLTKYMVIPSASEQIKTAICEIDTNRQGTRNLVVLGKHSFGITTVGVDFARSFYEMGICKNKTVAVIKAVAFNKVDLKTAISKLNGGCLVIENAGNISSARLEELAEIMENKENDICVIFNGESESVSRLFANNPRIVPQFSKLIQMNQLTDEDVFEVAQCHIKQSGYVTNTKTIAKLKSKMLEVESGNLDRVLKMVDAALQKAQQRLTEKPEDIKELLDVDFN